MLSIPPALQAQFEECLRNKAIPKKRMGLIRRGNGGQDIFFSPSDRYRLYLLLQEGIRNTDIESMPSVS